MSAPVFLLEDLDPDVLVLLGAEGRHAATVRRVRLGESVDLVDGRGGRAECTVASVGRDTVDLVVVRRTTEPVPTPRLVLVQAIAKGDRGERAVELATEVGIDEIVPWAAQRCIVKWDGQRGSKALDRWRSTAGAATKQSRRAWLPEVSAAASTTAVAARLAAASAAFVLHESAVLPLSTQSVPDAGEIVLVVGPEGGISDDELAVLTEAGGVAVRLGPTVLRTSTAGAAAAAVLSAMTSRWR